MNATPPLASDSTLPVSLSAIQPTLPAISSCTLHEKSRSKQNDWSAGSGNQTTNTPVRSVRPHHFVILGRVHLFSRQTARSQNPFTLLARRSGRSRLHNVRGYPDTSVEPSVSRDRRAKWERLPNNNFSRRDHAGSHVSITRLVSLSRSPRIYLRSLHIPSSTLRRTARR